MSNSDGAGATDSTNWSCEQQDRLKNSGPVCEGLFAGQPDFDIESPILSQEKCHLRAYRVGGTVCQPILGLAELW